MVRLPSTSRQAGRVGAGFRLRRAAWGNGYATEGSRALIRKGFMEWGVGRVVATTYEDNLVSRRVLEKVGLTLVGRYRPTPEELAAHATFATGEHDEPWDGDDLVYALEEREWRGGEAAGTDATPA